LGQFAYIFVLVLFAFFLGTVILSNVLALITSGVIRVVASVKARRL